MNKYIVSGVLLLLSLKASADVNPSTAELMQKCAQTQDEWQSSFISKIETKEVCTDNFPKRGLNVTDVERNHIKEFRWDGERIKSIKKSWGWTGGGHVREENNKSYNSWLFDGENFYTYVNGLRDDKFVEGYPGKGFFSGIDNKDRNKKEGFTLLHTHPFLFYFGEKRVDDCIGQDKNAVVKERMELVGKFNCYVVTTRPQSGAKIKVWIDPEHGYNIAKYESRLEEGFRGPRSVRPLDEGIHMFAVSTVLDFKRIDDVWVPIEVDYYSINRKHQKVSQKLKIHYKQTEFLISPDHEALGSFEPDDIQNGALIMDRDARYRWQDGGLVEDTNDKQPARRRR